MFVSDSHTNIRCLQKENIAEFLITCVIKAAFILNIKFLGQLEVLVGFDSPKNSQLICHRSKG